MFTPQNHSLTLVALNKTRPNSEIHPYRVSPIDFTTAYKYTTYTFYLTALLRHCTLNRTQKEPDGPVHFYFTLLKR